jgi:hypothetical protein
MISPRDRDRRYRRWHRNFRPRVVTKGRGGVFAPSLPRETYERVYEHGPDVIFAGSIQSAGTAEATSGGWRVSGR